MTNIQSCKTSLNVWFLNYKLTIFIRISRIYTKWNLINEIVCPPGIVSIPWFVKFSCAPRVTDNYHIECIILFVFHRECTNQWISVGIWDATSCWIMNINCHYWIVFIFSFYDFKQIFIHLFSIENIFKNRNTN